MGRLMAASALVLALSTGMAAAATPASLSLSNTKGKISLVNKAGKASPISTGSTVKAGDKLLVPREGSVTIVYPDKCTLTFAKRGTFTVPSVCDAKTAALVGASVGSAAVAGAAGAAGAAGVAGAAAGIGTGGMIAAGVIGTVAVASVVGIAAGSSDSNNDKNVSP